MKGTHIAYPHRAVEVTIMKEIQKEGFPCFLQHSRFIFPRHGDIDWIVIDDNKGPAMTIKLSLMSPWALHGLAIFYIVILDGHIELLMEPTWNPWWSPCQLRNDLCCPNNELMMWLCWLTHAHGSCRMMYWWNHHYVGESPWWKLGILSLSKASNQDDIVQKALKTRSWMKLYGSAWKCNEQLEQL